MDDYSDWEYIFQKSWDVITGEIPGNYFIPNDELFSSDLDSLDQLAVIIRKCRELLEVDDNAFGLEEINDSAKILSKKMYLDHEVEGYWEALENAAKRPHDLSPGYLCLIREIFGAKRSILQYLDDYKYGPGYTYRSHCDKLICSARDIIPTNTPEYIILAVLTIKESYHQAYDLVMHGEEANPSKAHNFLLETERRLANAKLESLDTELEEAENEIKTLTPLAEKEKKAQADRSKGGKERAKKYQPQYSDWQKAAEETWHKNKNLSASAVARSLEQKFNVSWEQIRKKIKKPG